MWARKETKNFSPSPWQKADAHLDADDHAVKLQNQTPIAAINGK